MSVINDMVEAVKDGLMPYDDFLQFEQDLLNEYELAVSWQDDTETMAHVLLNLFLAIKSANTKQAGSQPIRKYINECEMAQFWEAKVLKLFESQQVA